MADAGKSDVPEWVTTPPELTLVSDSALKAESPGSDTFDLARQIGPLFEILRHPATETPFAAAIYGDWGTGKTSAMRWLEGRLGQWNDAAKEHLKKEDDVRIIRTAWFYPWKYQERQEVWRGLVAEVILACLSDKDYTLKTFTRDARDLGRFLGRSIIHILSNVKVSGGGVEAQMAALRDIARDFDDTVNPEAAYLNEFETVMRDWVKRSLKHNERLVVFIDDLDRCMPDIALQVLEALKLYLDIERLMFVIGVDKTVVDQLVIKRYDDMGVDEEKAKDYLAKMFQVEIPLAPTEGEVESFFAGIVSKNETWSSLEHRKDALEPVVIKLANRSPREIKRLINSALIHASGVRLSKLVAARGVEPPTPEQGVQDFLVRRILGLRHSMESAAGSRRGSEFFQAWSAAVRARPEEPPLLRLTAKDIERLWPLQFEDRSRFDPTVGDDAIDWESERNTLIESLPAAFRPLLRNWIFVPYFGLLGDEELGALMRIPYPADPTVFSDLRTDATLVIREAIAQSLDKNVDEITRDDFESVSSLSLFLQEIEDLSPLAGLTSLESLSLRGTQVHDVSPLAGLTSLERILLQGTQVHDVSPLAGLTSLESLYLQGTQVQDVSPLAGLTSLESLSLQGTQVQDVSPLAGLTSLGDLDLDGTQVHDVSPLAGLTSLVSLDLRGTQVQDVSPLAGLTSMVSLDLRGTQVHDVSPLAGLTSMVRLDLQGTQVQDVSPLAGLTSMVRLYLQGTQVQDVSPLAGLTSLESLSLQGTQVQDVSPLAGLTSLESLDLQGTQVHDVSPLAGLTSLESLYLQGTQVQDVLPLAGVTSMVRLDLQGTQVQDVLPLATLANLRALDLSGNPLNAEQIDNLRQVLPETKILAEQDYFQED